MEGVVVRGSMGNLPRETEGPQNKKCKCVIITKFSECSKLGIE